MIANLCALTNQCSYQFNGTSESDPGAQNTHIVLYARLDEDDCRLYEVDYMVYILMRLPLIGQCFISATDA